MDDVNAMMSDHVPVMVNEGDIAVVKAIVVAGKTIRFKKKMRIPVERLGDCQLVLDHIESPGKGQP